MARQRTIRRPRLQTRTFHTETARPARPLGTGALGILAGFAIILAAGVALLMLPVSAAGDRAQFSDALFTAVSAVTVTGLVTVDTQAHWSLFGEAVIIALIQIGGLGYMLGVSLTLWVFGRRLGLQDRHLLRQYYGAPSMGEALHFAKRVALFALVAEAIGVIALFVVFVRAGIEPSTGVWWSLFHGISAFNNAGFNITGADMIPYREDPFVLGTIGALVIAGGIGALPFLSMLERRSVRGLPLDHMLILVVTVVLLLVGMAVILVVEWQNQATLGGVDGKHRPMLAFFQSAMPRTAGFSAVDVGLLHDETRFFTVGLMFIGGAAGSTAGGIKVGAFALLFFVMLATLRGRQDVVVFGRIVPMFVIRQALTIALLGVAVAFAFAATLAMISDEPFLDVLLEAVSALGTVGLSTGITADLSAAGQGLLMVAMLVGRFGPLVLVLEMTRPRRHRPLYMMPEDSIRLG